jgi:mannosyltransferase
MHPVASWVGHARSVLNPRPTRAQLWAISLVGLTLLAFGLRLYGLGFQSLWRDETDALLFADKDLLAHLRTFTAVGENGALYFALLGAWIGGAGSSEVALRMPSALVGTFTIPLTAVLGRRLLGPGAGLMAAALLAISPYHIWYSQEAKMYTIFAADTTAALLALLLALARGGWWRWVIYVFIVSAGFYIHLLSALQVLVHLAVGGLSLAAHPEWRANARGFAASMGILLLPYIPLALWQFGVVASPPQSGYPEVSVAEALRVLTFGFSANSAPVPSPAMVFGNLLLVTSALALAPFARDRTRHGWFAPTVLLAALAIPVAAVLLLQVRYPLFQDRYLISSLVPYELLMGAGTMALWANARPLAPLALLLVAFVSMTSIRWSSSTPIKSDFRAAAQLIEAGRKPGDRVMFVMPYTEPTFRYYAGNTPERLPVPYIGPLSLAEVGDILNAEVDSLAEAEDAEEVERWRALWLVVSEPQLYDPQGFIPVILEDRSFTAESTYFANVEVRRYELIP